MNELSDTVRQADLGTPPSRSTRMISIEVDGKAVEVPAGTSVMRAARETGTAIPKL